MKKWLIPVVALVLVGLIAVATKHFVLDKRTIAGEYKIYMVAIGDKGRQGSKIGCGDSLVEITRQTVRPLDLTDVYQDVVGEPGYDYSSDLRNPLAHSTLNLDTATIDDQGKAHIYLSGTLKIADDCEAARVKAQLEKPVRQFNVKSVDIKINNKPIDELLK